MISYRYFFFAADLQIEVNLCICGYLLGQLILGQYKYKPCLTANSSSPKIRLLSKKMLFCPNQFVYACTNEEIYISNSNWTLN